VRALKVSSGRQARMIRPRIVWLGGVVAAGAVSLAVYLFPGSAIDRAFAQEIAYFRIGAGSPGSTLYDLAGQIAAAISNPPGSRQCDNDGPCGVEGLIGIAQTTMRPADGLQSVEDRVVESAIVSADIAAEAVEGSGPFKKSGAMKDLRAIANVGQLVLHVLVAKEAQFKDLAALKGKRIAIGEEDSDNAVTARSLLRAAGLTDKKAKLVTGNPEQAAQDVLNNEVDALVVVAKLPSADVAALMRTGNYRLLAAQLADEDKGGNATADTIPQTEYSDAVDTSTLSVPAIWIVNATLSDELADGLVKALWRSADKGEAEPGAGKIHLDIDALSVPLHPGARAAFKELGMAAPAETPPPEPQPSTTN
jgi:uncharacterized protein